MVRLTYPPRIRSLYGKDHVARFPHGDSKASEVGEREAMSKACSATEAEYEACDNRPSKAREAEDNYEAVVRVA